MILILILSLIISFPVYASTPGNYDPGDVVMTGDEYFEFRGFKNPFDVEENEMDNNQYTNDDSSSNTGLLQSIKDILLDVVPQKVDDVEHEIKIANAPLTVTSSSGDTYHKNVVVYEGRFNNQDVQLIVPYSDYSKLDIINGILVNIGSSSLTGRFLYDGDILSPSEYDTYSYILNPVYGSTANVYQYGSFNYQRHYYLNSYSGGYRITYTDTYGYFYPSSYKVYYSVSERQYYLLMVILLFMGVMFLWIRRH